MKKSKILLSVFAIIITLFVGIFAFTLSNKDNNVAYADSVTTTSTFNGSGIFSPLTTFRNDSGNFSDTAGYLYACYFTISELTTNAGIYDVRMSLDLYFTHKGQMEVPSSANMHISNPNYYVYADDAWHNLYLATGESNRWYCITYKFDSGFNCNVVSIQLNHDTSFAGLSTLYATDIQLIDTNNKHCTFLLPYAYQTGMGLEDFAYTGRYYFLNNILTDNQFYQTGYTNGKRDGEQSQEAYSNGFRDGKREGEDLGYTRGVTDSNQYSFLGIFGAVVDVPINAIFGYIDLNPQSPTYNQRINGLLNFNLFGVNLSHFLSALLTIGLVILVLRFIVGGGK